MISLFSYHNEAHFTKQRIYIKLSYNTYHKNIKITQNLLQNLTMLRK